MNNNLEKKQIQILDVKSIPTKIIDVERANVLREYTFDDEIVFDLGMEEVYYLYSESVQYYGCNVEHHKLTENTITSILNNTHDSLFTLENKEHAKRALEKTFTEEKEKSQLLREQEEKITYEKLKQKFELLEEK